MKKELIPYSEDVQLRKGDIISDPSGTIFSEVRAVDNTGQVWISIFLRRGTKEFSNRTKAIKYPRFRTCYRGFTPLVFLKCYPEYRI